jgi:hypothetical protein
MRSRLPLSIRVSGSAGAEKERKKAVSGAALKEKKHPRPYE